MTYNTINDAMTMAGGGDSLAGNGGAGRSIGDGPTMRPKDERGGRGTFVPGDIIAGRYVVEQILGEGGMGIVYQCLDRVGGVKVAVKCLPPEVSRNAEEMEDIRANYRLVADLHHPNIAGARTLERDDATGDYYLVMDLAPGMSLKRWMKRNPQASMEVKLSILRQVAAALDYAHSEKVIHRDVKPENVMVDSNGRVKVLDFGLAAQIRSSQSRTSAAVTSKGGTPGYKSPEQWRGKSQREPADVYSFGVMAYWMFAGVLPFDGDDPVVLGHAVLTEPVEPIAGLPAHMNAALVKALAKAPEERFASCGEFVDALEGKVKVSRRGAETQRSGGGRAALVVAALCIAVLASGVWWWKTGATRTANIPSVSPVPVVPEAPTILSPNINPPPTTGDPKTLTLPGGVKMEMIYVVPGSFTMGSPTSEDGRYYDETQHRVTLTKGYWLGKYEVTQRQWKSVMGENPSRFKGDDRPVENVSWEDCQRFISKVDAAARRQLGCGARLPTEAEWEYACRAGSTGPYGGNGNLDDMGWYDGNSGSETHEVGQKRQNAWGFHDMHGNVWECCADWDGDYPVASVTNPTGSASGDYRVLRGGGWEINARLCRSAIRGRRNPGRRGSIIGFRLCCSAGPRE